MFTDIGPALRFLDVDVKDARIRERADRPQWNLALVPAFLNAGRAGRIGKYGMFRSRKSWKWIVLAAGLILVRSTCLDWHRVTGRSMLPTLRSGDLLVCNRLAYGLRLPCVAEPIFRWHAPLLNEVVVFRSPVDDRLCVKRVGSPPNGQVLASDQVWLEGDNRGNSYDSRSFGPVPLNRIQGRATAWNGRRLDQQMP